MILEKDSYCITEENRTIKLAVYSSIGDREEQQDRAGYSLGAESGQVVLCDGMGGHAAGRMASMIAVSEFLSSRNISTMGANIYDALAETAKYIDKKVHSISDEKGNWLQAGTTFIAVVVSDNKVHWASVGDSRIYLHKDNKLYQLNEEHTYEHALDEMLKYQSITKEEYDSEIVYGDALISFLGIGDLSIIDGIKDPMYLESGDKILIMSDGLYKIIPDNEICSILNNFADLSDALSTLDLKVKAKAKRENIQRDNMTLALIKMK